jgi:hypothetical protein
MSEHTYKSPADESPEIQSGEADYSIEGILSRIDSILSDTSHIYSALETLSDIPLQGGNDFGAANKAEAIAKVVAAREATNQQALRFLERMYDELAPQRIPPEIVKFKEIMDSLKSFEDLDEEIVAEIIEKAAFQMFSAQPIHVHSNYVGSGIPEQKFGGKFPKIHIPKPAHGKKSFNAAEMLRNMADQFERDDSEE